ncbi:MAG: FAD-dependent monooxygenase [Alkalilacustris sp.]
MVQNGTDTTYPYARASDQDAAHPVCHPVVVAGAGLAGLVAALDLAQRGVPVVVVDAGEAVSAGSRAMCFARRTLDILGRLGCADAAIAAGIPWHAGQVYRGTTRICAVEHAPEADQRRPAFLNLPQAQLEAILVGRLRALQADGVPIDLRGANRIVAVGAHDDHVRLEVETPEGPYSLHADWLVACDGAGSPVRRMMGLACPGRGYEDAFLIADVAMDSDMPPERQFWFDPPFNPGRSALLHKQPGDLWRIDLQIGADADAEAELAPDHVLPRLRAMLGPQTRFALQSTAIYRFHCRRMERFVHGRVVFAGDAAHQVSPFGARGANSGMQDADNLGWKLAAIWRGADPALIESYNWERGLAAEENILAAARASDFITPRSAASRALRDAVLALAERHAFAQEMVNTGRMVEPCVYDDGPLNGPGTGAGGLPALTRPGAPAAEAPCAGGWLLDRLPAGFALLAIDCAVPEAGLPAVALSAGGYPALGRRWLGDAAGVLALIRPDGHVAARWAAASPGAEAADAATVRAALALAGGSAAQAAAPETAGAIP